MDAFLLELRIRSDILSLPVLLHGFNTVHVWYVIYTEAINRPGSSSLFFLATLRTVQSLTFSCNVLCVQIQQYTWYM